MARAQLLQRMVPHNPEGAPCCETTTVWQCAEESHTVLKLGLKNYFVGKTDCLKMTLNQGKEFY